MADKDGKVIVEMTSEQLGLSKGATTKQVLDRMQELGMRPMRVDDAMRMLEARPISAAPPENMFALSRGGDSGHWQTPSKQFELPNLSAIDHDPIIPGVFLDGKPLRQSDCKRLRPPSPDDNPHDWMTPAEIDREMMEDMDAMDRDLVLR